MADLRLVGGRLSMVRALAESRFTRGMLWSVVSRDFHFEALEALPRSGRGRVEEVPKPVQGAAPRQWGEADLGAPDSPRCTGAKLRAAFAKGDLTPVDVLDAVLAREDAKDFGPSTNSPWVALDRDGARAAAEASAARWKAGEAKGPLDGLIVPVKDEFHMRGLPTRGGTSWRNAPVDEDAFIVTRMRDAGAVLLGKAHCTENGMNPLGFNPNFDYPRNVYSAGHGAGGSSTGSAVAVGLGLATVAVSTDGGGSIRVPASLNGQFGLKPSLQRFGRSGDIWVGTVGHTGPIGQSTPDLVDLMEVCSAHDPGDPFTDFPPDWGRVESTWRPALGRGIRGCRIGILPRFMAMATPEIAKACEVALKALEAEGAILTEIDFPLLAVVNAVGPIVIAGESAANAYDDLVAHRTESSDELRLVYALMDCISAQEHLKATRVRTQLRWDLAAAIAGVDLLALPTTGRLASPYPLSESRVQIADTAWTASMTEMNFLANLTGVPAASVPVGLHDGLPIGLQLVGDAWDEASVIAGCAHLERLGVTQIDPSPGYRSLL
ncbi:MAG: amidase [Alphaproteobacteria bacterium]|nr:amidase [Alphaproteobacteria bacterium]